MPYTEVDICNLALSHIGDSSSITSISPPEGSAQAVHCARFYPIARDLMLASHAWECTKRRIELALLSETPLFGWEYAYAMPNECKEVLGVYESESQDDINSTPDAYQSQTLYGFETLNPGEPTPQPFVLENNKILTNVENAIARYKIGVTDTAKFSDPMVAALSRLLASMISGPIIKGEAGAAECTRQLKLYHEVYLPEARTHDSGQKKIKIDQGVKHLRR